MIPALAPRNIYQGLGYYQSTGVGTTATRLAEFINAEAMATFQLAVSLRAKFDALCELFQVYKSCSNANWDSEGAEAISEAAYQEAARFIRLLPVIFPMPEIVPEPNGQVGFEWHLRQDNMLVVALGGTQVLTFAGLFGGESSVHGTDPFSDSVPESVVAHLQRLFGEG
jgi:hypothetical protein